MLFLLTSDAFNWQMPCQFFQNPAGKTLLDFRCFGLISFNNFYNNIGLENHGLSLSIQ